MKRPLWIAGALLGALVVLPSCRTQRANRAGYSAPPPPRTTGTYQPRPRNITPPPQPYEPDYSGSATPAAPPSYSRAPAPPPSTSAAPPVAYSREFVWAGSLDEARRIARQQGKMVFIETGRDACGNCQELKRKIIPSAGVYSALGEVAVGYYDDCERDPNSEAFRALMAQLPRAMILPLVGFFTPDMRWVHGFSGHTDEAKFLGDIATAKSSFRRIAEADVPSTTREVAEAPAAATAPAATLPVEATPADALATESLPADEIADVTTMVAEVSAPAPAPAPEVAAVVSPAAPIEIPAAAAPAAPAAPSTPVEAPAPAPTTDVREWARAELRRAAAALAAGDVATTRSILESVREKADGFPEGREADKGDIAIHAKSCLAKADSATVRADAAKALRGTVWADLFQGS